MKNEPTSRITGQEPEEIRNMFNAIAPTYDRLNHLLSLGLDIRWRGKAIRLLAEKRGGIYLDIAAGSGDLSLEALNLNPKLIVATDFAQAMLSEFRKKIAKHSARGSIELVSCDAHALPFRDESFDATMVAFGIRNFADKLTSMKEMVRVLKPGGISMMLELSKPTAPVISQSYDLYSRMILPLVGKIISRHNSAYRYLPDSIARFPERNEFLEMMERAGFSNPRAIPLTFGVAMIYLGTKT